jgi:hypothetical protein
MKIVKIITSVICGLAAFSLAFRLTSGRFGGPFGSGSVEQKLVKTAEDFNKRMPVQIDPITRCDRVEVGPGKTITFFYSISQSLSPEEKASLETMTREKLWSDQRTKSLLQSGVTFGYRCFDVAGNEMLEFSITPDGKTSRPASVAPERPEMPTPPSAAPAPPRVAQTAPVPGPATAPSPEYRTWRDATGQFQVEARFVARGEGGVTLKKRDEKEVVVPLERLSQADQDYVAEIALTASSPSATIGPAEPLGVPSAGRPADLLSLIDPRRDQLQGEWRMEDGSLVSPVTSAAMIQIPYSLPEEYSLTLVAEPIAGSDGLNVGIVVGGCQTMVSFDGWGIKANGLNLVDGKTANSNETTKIASVFTAGSPTTIVCTIRKSSVEVTTNGQSLFQWSGDPGRLSLDERFWSGAAPGRLFLGSWETSYRISRLELVPLGR